MGSLRGSHVNAFSKLQNRGYNNYVECQTLNQLHTHTEYNQSAMVVIVQTYSDKRVVS